MWWRLLIFLIPLLCLLFTELSKQGGVLADALYKIGASHTGDLGEKQFFLNYVLNVIYVLVAFLLQNSLSYFFLPNVHSFLHPLDIFLIIVFYVSPPLLTSQFQERELENVPSSSKSLSPKEKKWYVIPF